MQLPSINIEEMQYVQHKIVGEILYATLIYQDQIRVSDKCDNTAVYSNSQYDDPETKANMW